VKLFKFTVRLSAVVGFLFLSLFPQSDPNSFLITELRGQVEYLSAVDLKQRSEVGRTWRKLSLSAYLPSGSRIRTGENALAVLWLRSWGRLFIADKSVVEVSLRTESNVLINSAMLLDGRLGVEIPEYDERALYEVRVSQIQSRLSEGKIGVMWEREDGIAQFRQWRGRSLLNPILNELATTNRLDSKTVKNMIIPFNDVNLAKGQKVAFRDFRSTIRPLEDALGTEWEFMFKKPVLKSDSPTWVESRIDFPTSP
jgi:hypothetical protein